MDTFRRSLESAFLDYRPGGLDATKLPAASYDSNNMRYIIMPCIIGALLCLHPSRLRQTARNRHPESPMS
jgi:hypothetical protein